MMTRIRKTNWIVLGVFILIVALSIFVSNIDKTNLSPPQFTSFEDYFDYAQDNQYIQNSLTEEQLDNFLQSELVRQNYEPFLLALYVDYSLTDFLSIAKGDSEGVAIVNTWSQEQKSRALSGLNEIVLNLPSSLIFAGPLKDFYKIRRLRIPPILLDQCNPNDPSENICIPSSSGGNPVATSCVCTYGNDGMGPPNCKRFIEECVSGICSRGLCYTGGIPETGPIRIT